MIVTSETRKPISVGIAEMVVSQDPGDVLSAPNLGSCLGIAVFDPKNQVAGMVHCLLPLSKSDLEKAAKRPCMYVDTGVAQLLTKMFQCGAQKKNLKIMVAGGSNINDENGVFEIGKRNYTVLRKVLWKNDLLIAGEHVGGSVPRTINLSVGTGHCIVKVSGEIVEL